MLETAFDLTQSLAFVTGETGAIAGALADSQLLPDLPAVTYHADTQALSCSRLKPLLISPAHFRQNLRNPVQPTEAMQLGTVVHLAVLEPHHLGREVAVYPGIKESRAPEYKQFVRDNAGKILIDEPTYAAVRALATRILERRYKGRALGEFIAESRREATIYFTEPTTGIRLRVRFDILHPEISLDLKTTRQCTSAAFVRDAIDLHYDLQAFLYSAARALFEGTSTTRPFVFIAAETDAPHTVSLVTAGQSFLENGGRKLQRCLTLVAACKQTGLWPCADEDGTAEVTLWQAYDRTGI